LGSSSLRWRDVYLLGNLNIGQAPWTLLTGGIVGGYNLELCSTWDIFSVNVDTDSNVADAGFRVYRAGSLIARLANDLNEFYRDVKIGDAYKLLWSDVNLYRAAADVLKTDDSLEIGVGKILKGNALSITQRLPNLALWAYVSITAGSLGNGGATSDLPDGAWYIETFPSSMTVDLGRVVYQIRCVSFGTLWRGDYRHIPKDYVIEYSTDGTTWYTLASVTDNTDPFVAHLGFFDARYIRLTVYSPQSGQTSACVANFEVYGEGQGGFDEKIGSQRLYIRTDLIPTLDNSFDLGNASFGWRDIHLKRYLLFDPDVSLYRSDVDVLATDDNLAFLSGQPYIRFLNTENATNRYIYNWMNRMAFTFPDAACDGLWIEDAVGSAKLQFSRTGVITFSPDVNLYRSAADVLKTDDAFEILGPLIAANKLGNTFYDEFDYPDQTGVPRFVIENQAGSITAKIESGEVSLEGAAGADAGWVYLASQIYSDFELRAKLTPKSTGIQDCNFIFRRTDANNMYIAGFETWEADNTVVIGKRTAGTWIQLASTPFTVTQDQTYNFRIVCVGSRIEVWIDGNLILTATDSDHTKGNVGFEIDAFYSGNYVHAHFDDLRVIPIVNVGAFTDKGLTIGADVNLYRSAADVLKTDDSFDALALRISGTEVITSGRVLQNIASVAQNLVPDADVTRNLGSSTRLWSNVYTDYGNIGRLNVTGVVISHLLPSPTDTYYIGTPTYYYYQVFSDLVRYKSIASFACAKELSGLPVPPRFKTVEEAERFLRHETTKEWLHIKYGKKEGTIVCTCGKEVREPCPEHREEWEDKYMLKTGDMIIANSILIIHLLDRIEWLEAKIQKND